jgi:membrane protein implicated in regulation of membrane protease activity
MTWANFYLGCFVVGFIFSFIAWLSGGVHWHLHLPHWFGHAGVGHMGPVPAGAGHTPVGGGQAAAPLSPFNFATLMAFLAWFGGTGYLLTRYSSLWFALGLLIATGAGLAGAAVVFLFLSNVLISKEEIMDPADYEMVGVLARISSPVRAGGTGEIIYSQAGTRRTCGVRCEDGGALPKGAEVVVTRYEKGIAYVRRWEQLAGEE